MRVILSVLTLLLAGAACWQPEVGSMEFKYRGVPRWSGPWINPNIYGLLMGTGMVLAIGLLIRRMMERSAANSQSLGRNWRLWLARVLLAIAGGLCGFGLMKSYSRGAWLGAAVGLAWLGGHAFRSMTRSANDISSLPTGGAVLPSPRQKNPGLTWLQFNWRPLAVIVVSVFVILFWQFRHTEWPPARRIFSVANVNDFSWRNRVTAWHGALQMMADRPLAGFGWGRAEEALRTGYRARRLEDTAAIQMNDYLMLGISAGVPALIFFLGYIWFAFRSAPISVTHWLNAVCRGGALVLLLGFWFDGGLFKLPTAVLFWTLLELGRVKSGLPADGPNH
jgi:O-antigen ligase